MLALISPSKTLDISPCNMSAHTTPIFAKEIADLVETMQAKSSEELSCLMHISHKLAQLNYRRYQDFTLTPSKQAILSFKGDVYQAIEIETYQEQDFSFAQNHLRILSGLYGLLRPLDLIKPYRLEMGTAIKTKTSDDLYGFWQEKITQHINRELLEQKFLVNLASNEYFSAIDSNKLNGQLVNIVFKERHKQQLKIIGIFAKKARGMMVNYIIKNKVTHPQELKEFSQSGYKFIHELSTEQNFTFVRDSDANISS